MPPKIVKKPGAGGGQPAECGGASACAGAGADMKFVKSMGAKTEPTSVPPITEAQIIALNEQAQEIISKEPDEIKHAKADAMRLAGQMGGDCYSSADGIMPRRNLTANVFPFYIGRLNPPHKFHLISLFTTIFIARQYGTKALFMLGGGGGPNADNPLEDHLKWQFINEKLSGFGFENGTDYEIVKLNYFKNDLIRFIKRQLGLVHDIPPISRIGPISVYHIGGDKPEYRSDRGGYVLDVDKCDFLDKQGKLMVNTHTEATYHQVVIESGDSMVEVIDETGRPKVGVMSASLLRKTACICSNLYPHDEHSAFERWVSYFTPMYNLDATSLAIFRQIIQRSCGGKSKSKGGGGSRRKRTIRKLRNKKTIRRNYSTRGRGRGSLHRVRRDRSRRR
jgi:hypothetical protein